MKKLYKLLLICLLTIAGGGNALKAQSYNSDNSETANRAETPTYISKIAVAYGAEASTPKDILKNNGFTIIDKDLNAGCGSHTHYIYMGYKTTTNPADAITGIYIREGNDTPNSATFDGVTAYLLGGSTEDNPGENKPVDLNIDAGGATLHVYVSRNTNLAAITDIKFSNTNSMSGYVTQNIDLNKGASGEYIYLHYKQYSAQVYANFHYINESCQSVSKKFYGTLLHHLDDVEITPSIPTLLTYDDRSLAFMCWKDNTEAMMDYEYISKININLESSGMTFYGLYYFSPQTPLNLRFDANGGTGAPEDQKTDIYGLRFLNAGNGTPVYELSTFQIPNNICTKVGTCKFLGWSTDPNANSAEYQPGQSIDIALNTTLYAIYDSAHEYENGYCSICGAYEPAELVNGYYQIKTADNLFWFAEYVNTIDRTASAKLMNDIDLEGRPWTPIGTTGESSHNFRGHFDGNGKTITGLNVEVTRNGGGFFGEVRLGTVEDFTIYGEVKLNGKHSYVGGVIGSAPGANSNQPEHNGATIRNITSYVNVTLGEGSHGSNRVAGFIGYANHETLIENCTWYGTLDLDAYRAQDGVGGLVGKANDNSEITIRNCAAYGTIKTSYQSGSYNSHNSIYIGGIVSNSVASAQTTLENCIWAGTLIDNTNLGSNAHISAIGTLDGSKSVSNCYALDNMPYITTNNAHNTGITEVTAEQLASGEIAYKLQGTQATQIWGQNIDNGETADSKPILGGAKVYEIIYSGGGIYTNTIITASGRCGNNLYWKVSDNTLTIFGTGAMYNYQDNTINGAPWRSLNPAPTSLVMEEGITHIGDYAFDDCSNLTGSLTIPNSVTSIGRSAFYGCSGFIGDLTIGDNITSIGIYAFRDCSGFTGDLTIGNSVTSIEELTFYNCKGFSGSLTIGNSVTTIGRSAFEFCSGFKGSLIIGNSVTSIGEEAFSSCEGFTGSLTIPNSVKTIGEYAFYECTSFDGTLTIGNSVTSIEKCAFYFCTGFTEVYSLAKTAPTLGTYPFGYIDRNAYLYYPASCEQSYNEKGWFDIFSNNANGPCGDNLYWTVRDNILNIFGAEEMWDYDNSDNKAPWRSLNPAPTSLVLKEGVSHIGDYAFYNCSNFTEVYSWDETAPTLGIDAFKDANSNATLYYPVSSEQSYDENGWFNYFPQHIGFYGICGDNLYWIVDTTNTLTIFGTGAMYDYASNYDPAPWCSLNPAPTSLVLEEGITYIGRYAFAQCSNLTGDLTIPNSVNTIGDYAFGKCSGFNGSLTIPSNVTSIEDWAFIECSGFTEVYSCAETAPTLGTKAFTGTNSNAILYYPVSSEQSYNEKGWFNYFPQHIGFNGRCGDNLYWRVNDNILTIFGTGAMDDYDSSSNKAPWCRLNPAPTSLVLDEDITHIGNYAFYGCSSFTGSLTIPNSVTTIGNNAFQECSGFTGSLTIPNSVTSIGEGAFYNCTKFNGSLTIGNSVTTIGNAAFYGCDGFTEVHSSAVIAPTLGTEAFANINENAILYHPVSCEPSYEEKGWFKYFLQHVGADGKCGDNLYWYVDDENILTIFGTGAMYDYESSSNKAPWRSLNPTPTTLVLEEGITHIGNYAFYYCTGFTGSLTIPNSVITIGNYAFYECNKFTGDLTIPNSVSTIGDYAFRYCSGFTGIFFYRDANPTIGSNAFSNINANVYTPVIWESFSNIPEDKLVKMATYVRQQTTDNGQQSSSTGWVFPEGMTEVGADDHVAINAPMVISGQQSAVSSQQSANSLSVKSFGYCGNENTTNGRITIEDGGQLYCEVARGEVTVKKEIVGYAETTRQQDNKTTSETVWYTIASPLKDTLLISDPQFLNSSVPQFLSSNSDLYRYDEPSYTWQNAKNSANNGFNTIDPGRGYLYANAENTTLEFTGNINTETVTYNLTAKSDVLNGFHLIGNPFTHDMSIKTKITANIIFELNDSYGDGWNGNALKLSFSDETPDKIITIDSGNSNTETIKNVASGVTVTVSFTKGSYPKECSFTIKYDDGEIICDKYSNDGSLASVYNGATLTTFTVREVMDVLANGYYTLTGEGAWAAEASTTEVIKPMQSILVKSLVDDYELKIYNTSNQPSAVSRQRSGKGQQTTDNGQQSLCISVSNAKYSDRAFVVFDKGVGLDKMNHENENIPLLYIPMEDADYAIAMMDINVNEIPVNFETNVMGQYTISLRQENCEFDELYLLDKETDEKVNILEQDYTFIATSSENPERFILMKDNGQQTTDNRPWVYVNNGDIVIYNIEGDADIKIFDALGRCVYQGESSDETTRIANGYSSGVYMIQKVDDKGVNVQKVIID